MKEGLFLYRANNDAEFQGPVNKQQPTPAAFQTVASGTTATARLFNTANDTVTVDLVGLLTADVAASGTVIPLSAADALGFGTGDTVRVLQDSNLVKETTLDAVGPTSVTLAAGLDTLASENQTIRRVKMATTGKYFSVDKLGNWKIGLKLIVELDTTLDSAELTVDQVIDAGRCKLIRVTAAPASAVSSGQRIKNNLGAQLTGVDFGTPTAIVGDPEWGFRYPVLSTHTEIDLGMHLRAEMLGDDGSGIVARRNEFATVVQVI